MQGWNIDKIKIQGISSLFLRERLKEWILAKRKNAPNSFFRRNDTLNNNLEFKEHNLEPDASSSTKVLIDFNIPRDD